MFSSVVHIFRDTGRCRASIFAGPAGMQGRKESRSPTRTADGSWRVRPRNLSGWTTGKSRQTGRRDRVTAAIHLTLHPARRSPATMEARHSPYTTLRPH